VGAIIVNYVDLDGKLGLENVKELFVVVYRDYYFVGFEGLRQDRVHRFMDILQALGGVGTDDDGYRGLFHSCLC
jgi:hypothetical protein